ncbi:unnamed protein product [Caenorhabditis angaria]|uniref:Uncharacterized protein n=1 Tax=Caenorhabditis angaria TaxID=860376 RepID=A0A9P1IHT9_9PELO|nr:unnamed protein product [Caenorhabditis angaria]
MSDSTSVSTSDYSTASADQTSRYSRSASSASGRSTNPSRSSSRHRSLKRKRLSCPTRSTRSSRSRSRPRSLSRPRSSRSRPRLLVSAFKPCQDSETNDQIRGFLNGYSSSEQFECFTVKIDGMPFVAVSLMNADKELRDKYWQMPPPTPMRPSRNSENRPRDKSSRISTGEKSRKSVRFPDEKRLSDEEVERVLDGIVQQRKSYSDLWKDRENAQ